MRELTIGQVVQSTCGRDAGKYFILLAFGEKDFVLIADGKTHKIQKPKRKKIKHLKLMPAVSENMNLINYNDLQSQNAFLQKELQKLGYSNKREV